MIRPCTICQTEFNARCGAKICGLAACRTKRATAYSKRWRDAHREHFRAQRRARFATFTEEQREQTREWKRQSTARHRESIAAWQAARYRRLRAQALAAYGNVCVCCGEAQYAFLALDHIGGGGRVHRKSVGNGASFFRWLEREGYPEGFRVLCHNCNMAIGFYGQCPHVSSDLALCPT